MSETILPPELLYRAITLDPAIVNDPEAFSAAINAENGLQPGSFKLNEQGEPCVSTGDEHGVYMTPSRRMAETYAFVDLRDQRLGLGRTFLTDEQPVGFTMPDPELGSIRTVLQVPSLGVIYAIQTARLRGLRLPRYRNGREVTAAELAFIPEWIADEIPRHDLRPVSVVVGPDILDHTVVQHRPNHDDTELREKVSSVFSARMGSLSLLAERLLSLPDMRDPCQTARVLGHAHYV